MAPKKRTSVAAGLASPSPAKATRRAKAELNAKIETVVATLGAEALMPPSMPKRVLEMLAAGAPHALAAPVEGRHPLQASVLSHIEEVFDEAEAGLEKRLADVQAAADAKQSELEAVLAKVEATSGEILAVEKSIEEQQATVAEKDLAVKTAEQEQKSAEAGQRANMKERTALTKQMDGLKAVQEGGLNALVEFDFATPKDAQKVCTKFVKDMEKLGVEHSLLASAPAVLLKETSQRQGFDEMVIGSLRSSLEERLSAIDTGLTANATAGEELETALAQRASAVEASREDRSKSAETLQRLKTELAEKQRSKGGMEAEAEALRSDQAEKVGAVADAQDEVQCLRESKATLGALKARSLTLVSEDAPAVPDAAVVG